VKLFAVGEEQGHHAGDTACPQCWETYPVSCLCGGLIHAAGSAEADPDGNPLLLTRCDRCGRSEEDEREASG
jgi:hypothetical protein